MKKLLGLFVLLAISAACFSQDSIKMKDGDMQDTSAMSASNKNKDCLLMKNGQVMVVRAGQQMKLQRNMTLGNGTGIAPDGTLTFTKGQTRKLKEGEWIDMNGKMGKGKFGV